MTTPETPATPRPRRWTLLLAGVLAAALTATLWLWLARFDGVPAFTDVPADATGTSGGGRWRLLSLARADSIAGSYDSEVPVAGATYVVAKLSADLRAVGPDAYCTFQLVVGELRINADPSLSQENPGSVCQRRGTEPLTAVFEVPVRLVDQVRAVAVTTGTGTNLRLAGTLG